LKVRVSRSKTLLLFALVFSGIAHGAQTMPAASAAWKVSRDVSYGH